MSPMARFAFVPSLAFLLLVPSLRAQKAVTAGDKARGSQSGALAGSPGESGSPRLPSGGLGAPATDM